MGSLKILFFLILFAACSSQIEETSNESQKSREIETLQEKDIIKVINFPEEKILAGELILEDEIKGFTVKMLDTLLMLQLMDDERIWSVYNVNNLEHLGHVGRTGDSPHAFISPKYSGQFTYQENDYKVWLFDSRKYQLKKVSLFESLKEDKLVVEEEIRINPNSGLDQEVFKINDTLLVGNQGYQAIEKSRLKGYNPITENIVYDSGLQPKLLNGEQMIGPMLYFIYMDYIAITPSGEFLSAMSDFNRIDMFTKDLQLHTTITTGNYVEEFDAAANLEKTDEEKEEEDYSYYADIFAGKNQFYAMYRNQKQSEYYNVSKEVEIHVFDYDGNPIQKLTIPEYLISFTVNEVNGYIYGVDHMNEKILRYKL